VLRVDKEINRQATRTTRDHESLLSKIDFNLVPSLGIVL